jgi:hypothetical protein
MPTLRRRTKPTDATGEAIDETAMYTAVTSAYIGNDAQTLIRPGERYRGDHPAVRTASSLFVADSVADTPTLRRVQGEVEFGRAVPAPDDAVLAGPRTREDTVVAVKPVVMSVRLPHDQAGLGWAKLDVRPGDRLHREHIAVHKHPSSFISLDEYERRERRRRGKTGEADPARPG